MKKLFMVSLMIILAAGLILGGCTHKTTSTTTMTTQTQTSTSTTTTAPHKVLKIGSVQPMTMSFGVEGKKWLNLLTKLVDEQGGWKIGADTYDIEMIIYDSSGDAALSKNYLEKLVLQDGVKIILGSPTNNALTDAEVTEPNKVICLGVDIFGTSADPKIQYYYTPMGFFFASGYPYQLYHDMEVRGMKSYALLKSDDMMGHFAEGLSNAVWAVAAPDVKNLGAVFYDMSTSDYGPVATKLMTLHPDVIDCSYTSASAAFYNALYDIGYKGSIVSVDPAKVDAIVAHCGKAFVEGWEAGFSDPRLVPNQDPAMLALCNAYTKEYGTFITDGCPFLCNWFVLKGAIDSTQSVDVGVIKAYLDNQPYAVRNLLGYSQLFARPDAGNLRTVSGEPSQYTAIIKDGKVEPLRVTTVKDHYLATILCNGLVDVYKAYWEQYGYPTFPADETSVIKFSDSGNNRA